MKKSELVRELIIDNNFTAVTDDAIKAVQEVTGFDRALARTYLKNNIEKLLAAGKITAGTAATAVEEVADSGEDAEEVADDVFAAVSNNVVELDDVAVDDYEAML